MPRTCGEANESACAPLTEVLRGCFRPKMGRVLVFDGRVLHGTLPSIEVGSVTFTHGTRANLVCNVHHLPRRDREVHGGGLRGVCDGGRCCISFVLFSVSCHSLTRFVCLFGRLSLTLSLTHSLSLCLSLRLFVSLCLLTGTGPRAGQAGPRALLLQRKHRTPAEPAQRLARHQGQFSAVQYWPHSMGKMCGLFLEASNFWTGIIPLDVCL